MVVVAVACGVRTQAPSSGTPSELVDIGPDLAPVPFAPGSLARTFHAGATLTYRIEPKGKPPVLQTTEFVATTETGATMRDTTTDLDGTPQGEEKTATSTWTELESHAHFPREGTRIDAATVVVPAGRFEAWRYVLSQTRDGRVTTTRMWFGKELPGPPVKLVQGVDGEPVLTMSLVRTERP